MKKISWHEKFKEYSRFQEMEHIRNGANPMVSINEYSHISRISSRSINYETMTQIQTVDNVIVETNRVIEERRSTMIEIQGNILKVGDEVEICTHPKEGAKKITAKIVEVGATSEISTKTFYRTETGALFYIMPELGTNRHYNLGNRAFWIENPYISKNICRQCDYYLHGNPPVCNAFHEPGVSSCSDYHDKNVSEKSIEERRKVELQDFFNQIQIKIDIFQCRYNLRPSKILLHPIAYEHLCDYLRSTFYFFPELPRSSYERRESLIFFDTEVILSSSVPENYIGLVIDTIE